MITFNLIPTEPFEYQVYADWLEDQGVVLTSSIRKGIVPLDVEGGYGGGCSPVSYEQDVGEGAWNDEIMLFIETGYVQATYRRLKATWTYEAQQDLRWWRV